MNYQIHRRDPLKRCASLLVLITVIFAISKPLQSAAPLLVRISSDTEIAYRDGEPLPPLPPFGTRDPEAYWEHEELLWRMLPEIDSKEPDFIAVPTDEISIAAPFFDYSRRIHFAAELKRMENHFSLDSFAVNPMFTTREFRYPEDVPKALVEPIGTLLPGEYEVTARRFELAPDFQGRPDYKMVDFELFRESPLSYEVPNGFDLEVNEHSLSFIVADGPGDLNYDASLNAEDIDLLSQKIREAVEPGRFDLNGDGVLDLFDRDYWVNELAGTYFGDANLDGEFNTKDFVVVFQGGLFETDTPAGWEQGDWDGDGLFNSSDFVAAFQDGGYETGPRAVSVVPEPSTAAMFLLAMGALLAGLRRRSTPGTA